MSELTIPTNLKYYVDISDCLYSDDYIVELSLNFDFTIVSHSTMTQSGIVLDAMCLGLNILALQHESLKSFYDYPGLILFSSLHDLVSHVFNVATPLSVAARKKNKAYYESLYSSSRFANDAVPWILSKSNL